MKLNLGSGGLALDGFENLDGAHGDSLFPLTARTTYKIDEGEPDRIEIADESCEEIRASHVLEHWSHRDVATVLQHWVAKLAPGGLLRIAVPNFEKIARDYLDGREFNVQGFLYGGHADARDHHGCAFDVETLTELFLDAGLERLHQWKSEIGDCASLPVSLNLGGYKPSGPAKHCENTVAVLSAPRFGPVMHFRCAVNAFSRARVPYQVMGGAYWHQVMSEVLESQIADRDVKYVVTCDYDTVFSYSDVLELYRLMNACPDADAICPVESRRGADHALFGVKKKDGTPQTSIGAYQMSRNLFPISHGHFGLTIIRAERLRTFERPWMVATPSVDGRWGDGKKDADIDFWHHWTRTGRTLFLAPRVVVGHLQEMVTWPGMDMRPIYQTTNDYDERGIPQEVRR